MLRRATHSGFTLIELVLVLGVLALLMAAAAPSLRGWGKGAKVRDALDQVLTATRHARAQAIHESAVYRITVDSSGNALRTRVISDGAIHADAGQPVVLPEGFQITIILDHLDSAPGTIEFHPDGRTTAGRIELTAPWGERAAIEAATPAQPFRLVPRGGA